MNRESRLLAWIAETGLRLRPLEIRTVPGHIEFNRIARALLTNKAFRRARYLSHRQMMEDVYASLWRSEREFAARMASLHQAMMPVLEAAAPIMPALLQAFEPES